MVESYKCESANHKNRLPPPLRSLSHFKAKMSQHVVHFLGFMGLVETIVEFVYTFALRKDFTSFEWIFFLADRSCEMLGEVFAVFLGGRHVVQKYHRNVNVVDMFGVALKDPIHNMAYPHPSSEEPDLGLLSAASTGITVSNLSIFFWAIFFPFWGDFQGEEVARVLLSTLSCLFIVGVLVVNAVDVLRIEARGETREVSTVSDGTWICAFSAKYALRKAFGVYLLISNSDRLAPDDLGYALIGSHVLEYVSVLFVFLKALITDVYDGVAAEIPGHIGGWCFDILRVCPHCMRSFLRCFRPKEGPRIAGSELGFALEQHCLRGHWGGSRVSKVIGVSGVPRVHSFSGFPTDVGVISPQQRVARAHSFPGAHSLNRMRKMRAQEEKEERAILELRRQMRVQE
ncbi:unnamed protein product [Pylaiella littoralis]